LQINYGSFQVAFGSLQLVFERLATCNDENTTCNDEKTLQRTNFNQLWSYSKQANNGPIATNNA
jgi:hypothetical protein